MLILIGHSLNNETISFPLRLKSSLVVKWPQVVCCTFPQEDSSLSPVLRGDYPVGIFEGNSESAIKFMIEVPMNLIR